MKTTATIIAILLMGGGLMLPGCVTPEKHELLVQPAVEKPVNADANPDVTALLEWVIGLDDGESYIEYPVEEKWGLIICQRQVVIDENTGQHSYFRWFNEIHIITVMYGLWQDNNGEWKRVWDEGLCFDLFDEKQLVSGGHQYVHWNIVDVDNDTFPDQAFRDYRIYDKDKSMLAPIFPDEFNFGDFWTPDKDEYSAVWDKEVAFWMSVMNGDGPEPMSEPEYDPLVDPKDLGPFGDGEGVWH